MPFLDAIHIFFEPCVTLDVRTRLLTKSVFDREWDMTLEYVLHQPGLNAAYTSSLSIQHDLWVFLGTFYVFSLIVLLLLLIFIVWETEDDRHRFYKQTTGFGFVTDHLAKPPSVFLFGYAIYNELETAPDWTADVITPEIEDGEAWNYQPNAGGSQTLQLLNRHLFVARQEKDTTAQLYDGNDFDYAIIALTKTVDLEGEEDTRHGLQWSRYAIELHKCEQNVYSKTVIVEAPTSIAELIEKEPWEYGLLSPDESKYSDTAYPMNLTFRPMSTLSMAEKFQPDHKDRSTARAETTDEYAMCIIEFTISPHYVSSGASLIDDLRFKAKLEDGADGLRELSVLIDARSPDTIKFLTVWQGMSQLATWWDFLGSVCNSRWSWWTSSVPGLPKLCWEETSLTPDKQDWQEADKILEGVMFTFTDPLTPAEQKASEIRIQDLMKQVASTLYLQHRANVHQHYVFLLVWRC